MRSVESKNSVPVLWNEMKEPSPDRRITRELFVTALEEHVTQVVFHVLRE
jgi:hypothetical protein